MYEIYRSIVAENLYDLNKRTLANIQTLILRNTYNFMGEIPIYGKERKNDALKALIMVAMGGIEPPTPAL